ncbi:hypothetical protein Dsin_016712 [Dipteronia sinensis]|uniref:C-JID domain-containing protein n=1 Tax=Dipteronia sinensis TaxID=43782 RepID=A0AAE0ADN3_9ROSI|nr:hypothetical protein Dsin_016712 [Dipteronia sinensis]
MVRVDELYELKELNYHEALQLLISTNAFKQNHPPENYMELSNRGTNVVESISLDLSQINELQLCPDAFTKMSRLKFLKFYSSQYHEGLSEEDKVHLFQGLELLPEELRYLHWHRYPLKSLPSNFNPERLVEFEMPHSNIEQLWKEIQDLYLSHTAIEEIPPAIESLNKLVTLKLENCTRLKNLPSNIRLLISLTHLDLCGCSSITEFPEVSGNVESLLLEETAIEDVPSSIKHLTKLSVLSLKNCTRLKRVSRGILKLELMSHLCLEGCSKLDNLAIEDARLRSQFMANNERGIASTDDYPVEWIEEQDEGSSVMIDLSPNWYSNRFFGFVMCIVATFEDRNITIDDDSEFFVEWICGFIDEDDESHEVLCHVDYETVGHPNSSDHVFFVTSNRDLFDVKRGGDDDDDNGEGSSSIEKFSFSSCKEAYF